MASLLSASRSSFPGHSTPHAMPSPLSATAAPFTPGFLALHHLTPGLLSSVGCTICVTASSSSLSLHQPPPVSPTSPLTYCVPCQPCRSMHHVRPRRSSLSPRHAGAPHQLHPPSSSSHCYSLPLVVCFSAPPASPPLVHSLPRLHSPVKRVACLAPHACHAPCLRFIQLHHAAAASLPPSTLGLLAHRQHCSSSDALRPCHAPSSTVPLLLLSAHPSPASFLFLLPPFFPTPPSLLLSFPFFFFSTDTRAPQAPTCPLPPTSRKPTPNNPL